VVLSPDQRFFYWRIFAKFRPEKHGFDLYKGFFMEKKNGPNSPDFENKDSKIARLYDNFWKVARILKEPFVFSTFRLRMQPKVAYIILWMITI
jgi:hypothetical protein